MIYGRIGPPWWEEVWIVGGGPSARAFDLAALTGTVLTVNDASHLVRGAAVVSVDPYWISRNRDFLTSHQGERYFVVALEVHPECGGIPGAVYLRRGHEPGLSASLDLIHVGGNSGYAAINLAFLKKAKTINLIGFDMETREAKYEQWIPRFNSMLPQLSTRGVRVRNHNPDSAILAFQKVQGVPV